MVESKFVPRLRQVGSRLSSVNTERFNLTETCPQRVLTFRVMAETYDSIQVKVYAVILACTLTLPQKLHQSLPPFAPYISAALLPYLAFVLLIATFALGFYFSTYVDPITLLDLFSPFYIVSQKQLYQSMRLALHPWPACLPVSVLLHFSVV